MPVPIKRTVERIPGGMMLVPMAISACIATFAPRTGAFFGSFTGALFTGALPILAVFYVCIGAKISVAGCPIQALLGWVKIVILERSSRISVVVLASPSHE